MSEQLYLGTSPSCGHCTIQKSKIQEAIANNKLSEDAVAVVDCSRRDLEGTEAVVCKKATAFPSWHRNGKEITVGAGRDAKAICNEFNVCGHDSPYLN